MKRVVLDVPVFGQREAECGNTSLKAVCHYFGRRYSARGLGRLAHLTADGIDHGDLVKAAQATGAVTTVTKNGTLGQLHRALSLGIPPIIGWWSRDVGDLDFNPGWSLRERRHRDCGHYSVVCGMDDSRVLIMDPQWGDRRGRYGVLGHRWMNKKEFMRNWYDTDTDRYVRVTRWSMLVSYPRPVPEA